MASQLPALVIKPLPFQGSHWPHLLSGSGSNRGTPSKQSLQSRPCRTASPWRQALETEVGLTTRSYCNWKTITVFCQHHLCFFTSSVTFLFFKESVTDMNTQNQDLVSTRLSFG